LLDLAKNTIVFSETELFWHKLTLIGVVEKGRLYQLIDIRDKYMDIHKVHFLIFLVGMVIQNTTVLTT